MAELHSDYDLAIIGGGINGVGIARDAAGRGLRVMLAEQTDLASGTSSASTKLIHGGLRYLEHGALRLVRESLIEREVLLRLAPHIVWPMRFVLPHNAAMRPAWMLRLGLFAYDHIGGRKLLPPTRKVDLRDGPIGAALKPGSGVGFEYSDCWVDDARLVVLNAMDAAERGAAIRVRTRVVHAERDGAQWRIALTGAAGRSQATARILVNAAGPWVGRVSEGVLRQPVAAPIRLVKGSHIVVPRLYAHDRAYIFQSGDGRVVFAIPYETDFTLIGTTDEDFAGDLSAPAATGEEVAYLCDVAGTYFRQPVTPRQVVWSYAGVRPLYDDGASAAKDATRDYVLAFDTPPGAAPLLTVYGGKLTTYRRLAEEAMDRIARHLPCGPAWTRHDPLPGGGFAWDAVSTQVAAARTRYPFLSERDAVRMVRAYGTRLTQVLGTAKTAAPLGADFGHGLTAAEVDYLRRHEWAETAEDVLWRRTKLGLRLSAEQAGALSRYLAGDTGARAAVS